MPPEAEERTPGLSRAGLVSAGLSLVQEAGLDALSMRALADRLDVKAASLYWHVRDRRELVELLAESILDSVIRPRHRSSWRLTVQAICEALGRRVAAQKDAGRVVLEVPEALTRSDAF